MSFTPGPWSIEKEFDSHSIVNRQYAGDEWCVAEVYRRTDVGSANASLIAAAPELLEALEALFDDYKQLADSGDCGCWLLEDQEVGKKALAVIAKARGEGV